MEVSIRELRDNLSKYIQLANAQKDIVITSHDKPVAQLTSVSATISEDKAREWLTWSHKKPKGSKLGPVIKKGKTMADYVIEDRG